MISDEPLAAPETACDMRRQRAGIPQAASGNVLPLFSAVESVEGFFYTSTMYVVCFGMSLSPLEPETTLLFL